MVCMALLLHSLALWCFLAGAPFNSELHERQSPHARVELLSRQATLHPGSALQLGIHFILEPGWHIYWINPGDSGQPPSFKGNFRRASLRVRFSGRVRNACKARQSLRTMAIMTRCYSWFQSIRRSLLTTNSYVD